MKRGQGLVEFALVLPVLLLIICVVIDGGRLVYAYSTVAEAARYGAHEAQISSSSLAQVDDQVNIHRGLLGDLGTATTLSPSSSPRTPGTSVTITVSYSYRMITPLLSAFGPVNLTQSTSVTVE
jgi:Flp pilus assembly protein TadG